MVSEILARWREAENCRTVIEDRMKEHLAELSGREVIFQIGRMAPARGMVRGYSDADRIQIENIATGTARWISPSQLLS